MSRIAQTRFSALDLAPIRDDGTPAQALHNALRWRGTWKGSASSVSGSPNTTTWTASPAPPPPC